MRQAAQSADPVIRYSADRIRFPPAPIAALESIAPAAPLVRSLLNVQSLMRYGDFVWKDDLMVLAHAEVASALRGTGAGAKLAHGVFEQIEAMGINAKPTCPFLVRIAQSDPRWQKLFNI